jgi:hypothetical protein
MEDAAASNESSQFTGIYIEPFGSDRVCNDEGHNASEF